MVEGNPNVSFRVSFDADGNVLFVERFVDADFVKVTSEKHFPLTKPLGLTNMQTIQVLLGDTDPCIVQHGKLICW
jgi:hypothetical protein